MHKYYPSTLNTIVISIELVYPKRLYITTKIGNIYKVVGYEIKSKTFLQSMNVGITLPLA